MHVQIDYPKLAAETGMSNHRSTMNAWSGIRKKMQWTTAETPAGSAGASKATGATATAAGKRKKLVAAKPTNNEDDDADENVDIVNTPIKKAKATPRAKGTKTLKKKAAVRVPKTPAKVIKEEETDSELTDIETGSVDHGNDDKAEADVKKESGDDSSEVPIKSIEVADEDEDCV